MMTMTKTTELNNESQFSAALNKVLAKTPKPQNPFQSLILQTSKLRLDRVIPRNSFKSVPALN